MSHDPRVEAVAVAWDLDTDLDTFDDPVWPRRLAAVAVAALDAYDGPKFSSVVHECCERPTEADLRALLAEVLYAEADRHKGYAFTKEDIAHSLGIRLAGRIVEGKA